MPSRPAAVVGAYNTVQARRLPGETSTSLLLDAVAGVLADAGAALADVDGICAPGMGGALVYDLGLGPAWQGAQPGIGAVLEAAAAISTGQADCVLVVTAEAGTYTEHTATAPWTRPENEFVIPWGMFTVAEFALIARRHMIQYGTTPEQLAAVAATIRNNGHANPAAVYAGRGPFTPADVLASRLVADPFHLLDCSTTSEGGCALLLTTAERAADLRRVPVHVLSGGSDHLGPSYRYPPAWDHVGRRPGAPVNGLVGRRAFERALANAGLCRDDVDVLELYDPFSFEIIRQLEAFGFCEPGEGGPFVADGHIAIDGSHPVTTDGGTMSFSHAGSSVQMLQRVIRGVEQLRGDCGPALQVPGADVALCTAGGAGALFLTLVLLGRHP
ncbi:thiolase family protein [Frankia sp. AgB1.9]|uniref:thiolase family protein n=1 Tax=unclassified Frankia TaxID=2632575 RepID=UPI001933EFD8|nr:MULTISPECIES: thiolase family protein [unclassified Frankia]MBL7493505.1 thiolase family protein [Frankia sp. AgW1.1]MBL7548819.1 thiolase family protein [Frankia sp. AgB1.9]MBL7621960.1 thiolase family protein [Frankia sp. AgB1.8]